jgi:hypothetical protein
LFSCENDLVAERRAADRGVRWKLNAQILQHAGDPLARIPMAINQIIQTQQPQITAILTGYGVPMLDERNQPIAPVAEPVA